MIFVGIYLAMMALLIMAVYFGVKSGRIQRFLKKHPQAPKILIVSYIVFNGCFAFPIRSEPFPLDFQEVYLLVAGYGLIASCLARVFGPDRERLIYVTVLLFTAVGMACRYLLEYGEVSNTYNFTLFNIVSYLAVVPTGTVIAYHWIVKRLGGTGPENRE